MKASIWIYFVVGLAVFCHRAPVRAQPAEEADPDAEEPIVIDDPERPWNRGVSLEERAAARDLFLEGNRLARIPVFARAAEKYAIALRTWKHPALYFNLALAQINLDQEVDARENLERALVHGTEGLTPAELQTAKEQLAEVTRRLGRIRVVCRTRGAEVTLDGIPLFIGPGKYEGWIKAKAHELTAKKAGYQAEARRVTIASGQRADIDVSLVTLSQATDISRRWAAWKPWLVIGGGLSIAAAGGVMHSFSLRNFNQFDEEFSDLACAQSHGCDGDEVSNALYDRLARARQQQAIALGGYIAGGVVLSTGLVLLYMNRPRLTESPARRVTVIPTLGSDLLGILVSVSR